MAAMTMEVGLIQKFEVSKVADPTPEQIVTLADATRADMIAYFREAAERRDKLGTWAGVGNALIKVGQYVGGGGAVIFGFQAADKAQETGGSQKAKDSGRNAAYSGALAAGVTLLEGVFDVAAKKEQREYCADLSGYRITFESATNAWKARANDAAFRSTFFTEHYNPTTETIKQLYTRCTK